MINIKRKGFDEDSGLILIFNRNKTKQANLSDIHNIMDKILEVVPSNWEIVWYAKPNKELKKLIKELDVDLKLTEKEMRKKMK
ncbi:MAG: hypothetical protein KQA41_03865 [Candidatus Aenigmarchaeota archaeon]|nr:hypothetical protein [Candidatus Aenigmarchaeota archaeon]